MKISLSKRNLSLLNIKVPKLNPCLYNDWVTAAEHGSWQHCTKKGTAKRRPFHGAPSLLQKQPLRWGISTHFCLSRAPCPINIHTWSTRSACTAWSHAATPWAPTPAGLCAGRELLRSHLQHKSSWFRLPSTSAGRGSRSSGYLQTKGCLEN